MFRSTRRAQLLSDTKTTHSAFTFHRTIANQIPKLFLARNKHWKTIIKERTRTLTKDTQNNVLIIDKERETTLNETKTFFQTD